MTTKTKIISKTDSIRILIKKTKRILNKYIFKKDTCHIIFDACEKFHYFHLEPIIKKLLTQDNFKITITKWNGFTDKDIIPGVKYISFNDFWHDWFGLYDIMLSTELERRPDWFKDGIAICMFHGAGPKLSYMKTPVINDYDIIFSVGPTTYKAQQDYVDNHVKVEKIGLPISDMLLNKDNPPIPKPLALNSSKPTLLYAPSWSLSTEHISMDKDILDALSTLDQYNVIIRPHPNLLIPKKCNGVDWNIKLKEVEKKGVQLSFSHDHSAYELLPHADILLGDISAVTYEFLILERPILLYMKDGILDAFGAEEMSAPLLNATTKLQSAACLKETLDNLNNDNSEKSLARKELLKQTLFNVGHATEAAINVILKISNYK